MLLLTETQLLDLYSEFRDRFAAFVHNWISTDKVSETDIERLKRKGILAPTTRGLIKEAYQMGRLIEMLGHKTVVGMSLETLRETLRTKRLTIDPVQAYTVDYLETRACLYIGAAGYKAVKELAEGLSQQEASIANEAFSALGKRVSNVETFKELQTLLREGIEEGQSRRQILAHAKTRIMALAEVDVRRIVQTEVYNAAVYGQAEQMRRTLADPHAYKVPLDNACHWCRTFYLHEDGSPRIFKLSDLASRSNIGKRRKDWDATLEALHPHCRCGLYSIPSKGWVPLPSGALVRRDKVSKEQFNYNDWA